MHSEYYSPCPIVAMFKFQMDATLIQYGHEVYLVTGACAGVPDSAGEFQITADRTIDIWQQVDELCLIMIFYIAQGSGNKT